MHCYHPTTHRSIHVFQIQLANMYLEQGLLEEVGRGLSLYIAYVDVVRFFLSAKAEANFKETLRTMMAAGVAQVSS